MRRVYGIVQGRDTSRGRSGSKNRPQDRSIPRVHGTVQGTGDRSIPRVHGIVQGTGDRSIPRVHGIVQGTGRTTGASRGKAGACTAQGHGRALCCRTPLR